MAEKLGDFVISKTKRDLVDKAITEFRKNSMLFADASRKGLRDYYRNSLAIMLSIDACDEELAVRYFEEFKKAPNKKLTRVGIMYRLTEARSNDKQTKQQASIRTTVLSAAIEAGITEASFDQWYDDNGGSEAIKNKAYGENATKKLVAGGGGASQKKETPRYINKLKEFNAASDKARVVIVAALASPERAQIQHVYVDDKLTTEVVNFIKANAQTQTKE